MLEAAIFVVFPFCMLYAAISDILSMTIANRVSILLVASFAIIAPFTGMEWSLYGMHFVAGLAVLAVTFGLFAVAGAAEWHQRQPSSLARWSLTLLVLTAALAVSVNGFLGGALAHGGLRHLIGG